MAQHDMFRASEDLRTGGNTRRSSSEFMQIIEDIAEREQGVL
jgi:hypothetical protein